MELPDTARFYIDGQWVQPNSKDRIDLIDPATEEKIAEVTLASIADVDAAVAAAKKAFASWSTSSIAERRELISEINAELVRRNDEIAAAISAEMGAPSTLARNAQAPSGTQHFSEILRVLDQFKFSDMRGTTLIRREPVGVCALISPWNWPMNQVATKVAPALAAGCTMVLKPSEVSPLDAVILAEIIHDAGAPAGVFNLIHGTGQGIGDHLTSHPDVDMISFTGSTRAGVRISQAAAPTVKRVALELGGKSAGIVLDTEDLDSTVTSIVSSAMLNTGQSCNALTRLLVPEAAYDHIAEAVVAAVQKLTVGAERPADLKRGYFIQPTVFGDVTSDMRIARDEVFGPVLALMRYSSVDEAVSIANDSEYGLSGYVWGSDSRKAVEVASRIRTGMVHINGAGLDSAAPFGGYKMSGNGREWGEYGLEEFLEYKSLYGGALS
jgi:aldehyde dehydrogenase (NAD+)